MQHLAIDLGSKESQLCLRQATGEIIEERKYPTAELGAYLAERRPCRVVLETCSEAFRVADQALAANHQVRVVPSTFVKHLGVGTAAAPRRRTSAGCGGSSRPAAAATRSFLTKPVYQATAQILIEKQEPNVLNFQGVTDQKAGFGIDDYYQTQYKLLQSRSLARSVIQQLNLLNEPERGFFGAPGPGRWMWAGLAWGIG